MPTLTRLQQIAYRTGLAIFYFASTLLLAGVITGITSAATQIALAASAMSGGLIAHRLAPRALNQTTGRR